MTLSQQIEQAYSALRNLFKDKSELKGVDDWDTLIGILMLLMDIENTVKELESKELEGKEGE